MCQLLGMNSGEATDFRVSFAGFARRGGLSDKHRDGWGIAFYDRDAGLRTYLDERPAAYSPIAAMVGRNSMKTHNMLAHIRLATKGEVNLSNVHPFQREMWGIRWCFAHNGDIPEFSKKQGRFCNGQLRSHKSMYEPVGETDSEAFFCSLLNALACEFSSMPLRSELYNAIKRHCYEVIACGGYDGTILNFLLSCGPYTLFAFSWPGARPGSKVWNGLFYTMREAHLPKGDIAAGDNDTFSRIDTVAVIATKPLTTHENWVEMERGMLLMFDKGVPHNAFEGIFPERLGTSPGLSRMTMV